MEDYASLRKENMSLEQQNCSPQKKLENLEKELKVVTLKNEDLQRKLDLAKVEVENSMIWTRPSIILDSLHKNQSGTRYGI